MTEAAEENALLTEELRPDELGGDVDDLSPLLSNSFKKLWSWFKNRYWSVSLID